MAKNSKTNENYKHECDCKPVNIANYHSSLSDFPFSAEEIKELVEFYIFHAPILKNEKETIGKFGLRSLGSYGWRTSAGLNSLERKLLSSSNMPFFCILKSDSIDETAKALKLDESICIDHPRAILLLNRKIKVLENGEISFDCEPRMLCLFRHIRNALCHNTIYRFDNNAMLLEDYDKDNKKLTARILIEYRTLIDWMNIVKKIIK